MDFTKLAQRCAEGDESAWEEFVSTYSDCIYTSIRRTLVRYNQDPPRELLEDVFGDTLLLLLEDGCRRLRRFEGRNGSNLSTYLWVVASRCAVDHLRKIRVSPRVDLDEYSMMNAADMRELPGEDIERRQSEDMVEKVLGGLSSDDRLFVKLHYEQGLSTDEIAGILGVAPGTVYSRKNRVREKLQKIFRKEFEERPS